jgi:hypothetical protein
LSRDTVTIPSRFNGPPDSGNGGYTAGVVAGALGGGTAEVTLRTPPPLDRALDVSRVDGHVVVSDRETVVAEGRAVVLDLEVPAPVGFESAAAASADSTFLDVDRHPFPSCFVCGPARGEGDGLRIFAGPVNDGDGSALFAAAWTPPEPLGGDDGRLPDEMVWAALDCPTSVPVSNDPDQPGFLPIVLGRFAVRIDAPVVAGRPHVVMAWPLGIDGRKRQAAAALFTEDGGLCAVSRAMWIELRPPAATGE